MDQYQPSIETLPILMKDLIFRHLSLKDQKRCRTVCKDWKYTIDHFTKSLNKNYTNVMLNNETLTHVLINTMIPIRRLHVANLSDSSLLGELMASSNTNFTQFDTITFTTTLEYWETKNAELSTNEDSMKILLDNFADRIQVLKFLKSAFVNVKDCQVLMFLNLENLKELHIETIGNFNWNQHNSTRALISSCTFPNLQKLVFNLTLVENYDGSLYHRLYNDLYWFISRHLGLKDLTVKHPFDIQMITEDVFEDSTTLLPKCHGICDKLKQLSLEKLELRTQRLPLSIPESMRTWKYEQTLVLSQKSLRSLSLEGSHIFPLQPFRRFLVRNSTTINHYHVDLTITDRRFIFFHWNFPASMSQLIQAADYFYWPNNIHEDILI